MNNNYYNPCAQPYCRIPERDCRTNGVEMNPVHTENADFDSEEMRPMPKYPAVAMAYVPFQGQGEVYDSHTALKKGTLFPVLDKPFKGCCRYE